MVGFLHFTKIFQIPLIVANSVYGVEYESMFDAFVKTKYNKNSALYLIKEQFEQHAMKMQAGGSEWVPSKRWLNSWWPPENLAFIKVVTSNKMDKFYEEAQNILFNVLSDHGVENYEEIISQSINFNKKLLKLPKQNVDCVVETDYNIWDYYRGAFSGDKIDLLKGKYSYTIDRSTESWDSWEEWCKKVVWWCNKKGAYFYECVPTEQQNEDKK
jgi:hypothetical protein